MTPPPRGTCRGLWKQTHGVISWSPDAAPAPASRHRAEYYQRSGDTCLSKVEGFGQSVHGKVKQPAAWALLAAAIAP